MNQIRLADNAYVDTHLVTRQGETKLGERLLLPQHPNLEQTLLQFKRLGATFVLLGIPEDIGPRANLGRGGSDEGWSAFLSRFINLQHNQFINAGAIGLLGHIQTADLQENSAVLNESSPSDLKALRALVKQLDDRVSPVINAIISHDLTPIVIGGGHNNTYGIIKGVSQAKNKPISAINLDPHSDFRGLEGRHSGNGFSYAAHENYLSHYFSLGIHELKNSAENLQSLHHNHFPFVSYQQLFVRREVTLEQALTDATCYLNDSRSPIGIEIDVDALSLMPASAYTNVGMSLADVQYYIHRMAQLPNSCYLHLTEGSPKNHPAGIAAGLSDVGQGYSALVCSFIQAKQGVGE